ncbi:TNP2-like protein [Tanacetum coccineum]
MRHVADSLQWRNIDNEFIEFGDEIRNIRFGLSSDGINPFGNMSSHHSTWPVLLCIYNLPPWLCMKRKYSMMPLLIQGPKQPSNDIDIYLKLLIKDMQYLWSKGVEVYDAYKKETFQMRAMIFCIISDFLAYGNLSGYKTKGKMACHVCQDHTHSVWLANCKKTVYMGHRRSLQENHPYRKKRKLFDNNIEVNKLPPPLNRHATFSKVDDIHIVFGKGKEGTSTSKERKTKDGVKVRKDMEAMKIRLELAPREIIGKTSTYLPPACYTMSKAEKTKFCQCLGEIKVPFGYSASIKKLVSMQDLKLFGMKSHDCYVLMTQMIPIAIRGILPDHYSNGVKTVGILESRHEGRLHGEGTLGRQDFSPNIDDLREAHFTVLQHMTCIAPYIYEHKSLLKQQNNQKGQVWLANKNNDTFSHWLKNKVRSILSNVDKVVADLGFGPIRVVKYQGYVINGYTFYTKEQDDKSTLQNSRVTLIASTTELSTVNHEERSKNAKKAYYDVIQEIWELHYNSTVIPLFKCKWVDNEKGVDVDDDGFTTVNLSTNGYKSEPFILVKLATQAFYVKDPNDQRLHVVLYSKQHIVGVENVEDEDEYDQFDELPPFSIGITPSNDVLDDTTYLRSDHDEGLEDDNELALVDPPKRKKRGSAKLKDKPTEPFKVEFDKNGRAIGKHQNDWATYVGGMSRLRISIVADDWSKIEQAQKDALWEIIKEWICKKLQEISQKRTRERISDQEAKEIKAKAREIMPQPSTVYCS